MSTSIEVERKFDVADGFRLPPMDALGESGAASTFDLDATYYDTADLRLIRNRVTLRRRAGGHDAGWHLKRPAGGERSETQLPDAPDLPDQLREQVRAITRDAELAAVVRLRTHRAESALTDGSSTVLIALDQVEATPVGATASRWREVEVELVDGDRAYLERVAGAIRSAGATPSASPSKLARALGDRVPRPAREPAEPAAAAFAGYLRQQRDQMISNDPLVRAADVDGVHDMRVAVRRLRSALSTFGGPGGDAVSIEPFRAELKWLSGLIGAVRDGDVLADELITDIADAEPDLVPSQVTRRIRRKLAADADTARSALADALNSRRYFDLLDEVDRIADADPDPVTWRHLRKQARKRIRKADSQLVAAMADGTDAELHEARKTYKKARYAVELAGASSGKPARKLGNRLKALQDILGEHQDAVVAATLLKDLAGDMVAGNGKSGFGFGVLYAHERARAQRLRAAVPAAYVRAGRKRVRAWLDG